MELMTRPGRAMSLTRKALADLASVCDPLFVAHALRSAADAARARRRFRAAGGHIAHGSVVVGLDRLQVEVGAVVQTGCLLHCGGQDWSGGQGGLRLGARSYVGHHCVLYGAGGLDIGADVLLGPNVTITSQGHQFESLAVPINLQPHLLAAVSIGDGAWVGAGAVILPGVSIGAGAIVAAGAVVADDIPAFHLAAGVPARVIRERGQASVRHDAS
jgi:acetyltransferase-like isoleucine patch superfamily enzyme